MGAPPVPGEFKTRLRDGFNGCSSCAAASIATPLPLIDTATALQ
jgi:hypothetical protein